MSRASKAAMRAEERRRAATVPICDDRSVAMLSSWLHGGGDPHRETDVHGWSPLGRSIAHGHPGCLREIIARRGIAVVHEEVVGCGPGFSVAHDAAAKGHDGAVSVMLDHGLDVRLRDGIGQTMAHLAARNGHARCLDVLFARGADAADADHGGRTVLEEAIVHGQATTVDACVETCGPSGACRPDAVTSFLSWARPSRRTRIRLMACIACASGGPIPRLTGADARWAATIVGRRPTEPWSMRLLAACGSGP